MLGLVRGLSFSLAGLILLIACSRSSSFDAKDIGRPCRQSSECASARCVPRLGEVIDEKTLGVCTTPCTGDGTCLSGWSCLATASGTDLCQCRASKELCDGVDNDCNGVVDDAPGGTCSCPGGKAACGDVCSDLGSDRYNCGACGRVCPTGASCVSSDCTCAGTSKPCGSACVDLASDDTNCGACGNACGSGSTCSQGACRCGPKGAGDVCNVTASGGETGSFCDAASRCRSWQMVPRTLDVTSIAVGSELLFVATSTGYSGYAQSIIAYSKNAWTPAPPVVDGFLGGASSVPTLAAAGLDLVYSAQGATPWTAAKVVGCPNGVCGPELALERPTAIAAYGGFAYWAREGASVARCPMSGCVGGPEVVGDVPEGVMRLAVDASGVYVMYRSMLGRIPSGGVFEVLGPLVSADDLQLTSARVFVKTKLGFVYCAKSGCAGGATAFLVTGPGDIVSFVADDAELHWLSAGLQLMSCPATAATCVPSGIMGSGGRQLAQDAARLYIVEGRDRVRVLGKL